MRKKKISTKVIILAILRRLGEASYEFIDEGLLNPNYAFTGFSRDLLGLNKGRRQSENAKNHKRINPITLWRLKRDGLIARSGPKKSAKWRITAEGENYFNDYFVDLAEGYELPRVDGRIRIFTFDVPEKERKKRDRLREILKSCEYKMLQQSVWIGKRPLAKSAFKDIRDMKADSYIHLFEISKQGTIKHTF